MQRSEIKFLCKKCKSIVLVDLEELNEELVHCGQCTAVCEVPDDFSSGVVIDDFVIEKFLGTGGSGNVYRAYQFSLDRKVAIKVLKSNKLDDKKISSEFIKEARSVAKLNHPNIVSAYKVGVDSGVFFFAMELLDGQNLQDLLKKKKTLKQEQVIDIGIDIAKALQYAWENNQLVHRDIKPDNIILTNDGSCKLMDLGLSRIASETEDDSDIIDGTPHYMCPEQIMGQSMDIRGDLYSLGASLFHLVSGKFPFTGSVDEMIDKHLEEKPQPLKYFAPNIHKDFVSIIEKLMAKKPENRFQDGLALEQALSKLKEKLSNKISTPAAAPSTKGLKDIAKQDNHKDRKKIIGIATAICGLVLLLSFVIVMSLDDESDIEKTNVEQPNDIELDDTKTPAELDQEKASKDEKLLIASNQTWELLEGLKYSNYYGKNVTSLENLNNIRSEGLTQQLDLNNTKRKNNFAFKYEGIIKFPHTGYFTFYLKADDKARLFIDSIKAVESSLENGENKVQIPIEKGIHAIKFEYLQLEGEKGFTLEVESLRVERQSIPANWLFHIKK